MASQKLQVSRSLRVIPSDNSNIPFPAEVSSGESTSVTANKLVDSGATFITDGVKQGDIVYNTTGQETALVVSVDSETTLTLNADIFTYAPEDYVVYDGLSNDGCILSIGGAGDVRVTTAGGDDSTYPGLSAGFFLPVQVIKIWSTGTTASLVNANW